jgi:hypothetical protein
MWLRDGTPLDGIYGTWNGQVVEIQRRTPYQGRLTIIQDGGEKPSPEWSKLEFPNRFGRTPTRHYLKVPESEVSDLHEIAATGSVPLTDSTGHDIQAHVRIIAQDQEGRLAVETMPSESRIHWDALVREYSFEEYDRSWVFGWIPEHALTDFKSERVELTA